MGGFCRLREWLSDLRNPIPERKENRARHRCIKSLGGRYDNKEPITKARARARAGRARFVPGYQGSRRHSLRARRQRRDNRERDPRAAPRRKGLRESIPERLVDYERFILTAKDKREIPQLSRRRLGAHGLALDSRYYYYNSQRLRRALSDRALFFCLLVKL